MSSIIVWSENSHVLALWKWELINFCYFDETLSTFRRQVDIEIFEIIVERNNSKFIVLITEIIELGALQC